MAELYRYYTTVIPQMEGTSNFQAFRLKKHRQRNGWIWSIHPPWFPQKMRGLYFTQARNDETTTRGHHQQPRGGAKEMWDLDLSDAKTISCTSTASPHISHHTPRDPKSYTQLLDAIHHSTYMKRIWWNPCFRPNLRSRYDLLLRMLMVWQVPSRWSLYVGYMHKWKNWNNLTIVFSGWWFQPIWKILVKLEIFPK